MDSKELYRQIFSIRYVETRLLELFSQGKLNGTTHAYIGQEANGVGVISHLNNDDIVWSNHRCHGHYIAFTDDIEGLIHELVGTPKGVCAGIGGSQHLCNKNFFTNGVQGSIAPVATGMAMAQKLKNINQITTLFIGDGTLGEGAVYEAMNIASLWSLPILFVIENNFYAQSTPSYLEIAGDIISRPKSFAIESSLISSNDISITSDAGKCAVEFVRTNIKPYALVMETYRTCPHSKGDDNRDLKEIEAWREKDPLTFAKTLLSEKDKNKIENTVKNRVETAINDAISLSFLLTQKGENE